MDRWLGELIAVGKWNAPCRVDQLLLGGGGKVAQVAIGEINQRFERLTHREGRSVEPPNNDSFTSSCARFATLDGPLERAATTLDLRPEVQPL